MRKQLERTPKALPQLIVAQKPFDQIAFEDIELVNYQHDPFIRFEVAV
jgi:thymidylate synthase